jgi:RNA polymerase sigma-70 factor (ECF subfamily)
MNNMGPRDAGQGDGQTASISGSLLLRLQARDAEAWKRLVSLYGPKVYGWCRHKGLSEADAEDVGQEVWAVVSRSIADFRKEKQGDSFRGWLWTITDHKLCDFWDRNGRRVDAAGGATQEHLEQVPAQESSASGHAQASAMAQSFFRRALELIQTEFAEATWRAFLLLVVEDRRPADVAAELGKSLGAVYVAKSKVLHRLRAEFGDVIP